MKNNTIENNFPNFNLNLNVNKEFEFKEKQFNFISEKIFLISGIKLPETKFEMVYSRLTKRLRELKLKNFDEYIHFLQNNEKEWEHCINALTTNVTSFYRESHHFDILVSHAREVLAKTNDTFFIWSAGCSTGEEPYTIAMALLNAKITNFKIIASDLDTQALLTARQAVYSETSINKLPERWQKDYFLKGTGHYSNKLKLKPLVTEYVNFMHINLMDNSWPLSNKLDVIFCRNVMIYFNKETQKKLIAKFSNLLKSHGLFFAGHSESLLDSGDLLKLKGQTVYELAKKSPNK